MQDIYHYVQDGIDENGRAVGRFEATGMRPDVHGPPGIRRRAAARQRLPPAHDVAGLIGPSDSANVYFPPLINLD